MKTPIFICVMLTGLLWLTQCTAPTETQDTALLKTIPFSQIAQKVAPARMKDPYYAGRGFQAFSLSDLKKAGFDPGDIRPIPADQFKKRFPKKTPPVTLSLQALGALLYFEQNVGQAGSEYDFVLRSPMFAAAFNGHTLVASVQKGLLNHEISGKPAKGNLIQLELLKATSKQLEGVDAKRTSIQQFVGKSDQWLKRIPGYGSLLNRNVYKGIDMQIEAETGRLAYSFFLQPYSSIEQIRIRVKGAEKLIVDKAGNLRMITSGGPIVQTAPRFFSIASNSRKELKGRFKLLGRDVYGFEVDGHAPQNALLIDPQIHFTSYFGGSGDDAMLGTDGGAMDFINRGYDIQVGENGSIYVTGRTNSLDFPVSNESTLNGSSDAFVLRIDPTQAAGDNLVYAVYVGGSGNENCRAVAPLADGSAYITGWSSSPDFPTGEDVVQPNRANSGAFVAKLDPSGTFETGTYIGAAASNHPNSIVYNQANAEETGYLYLGGSSTGGGDATSNSLQATHQGGAFDGFVAKLKLDLSSYEYFTYIGGSGRDVIIDLDVNDGYAFGTGMTASSDFPTTDIAYQPTHSESDNPNCNGSLGDRNCAEAFVFRLHRSGESLIYSTYYGLGKEDFARGIAVSSGNQATITGATRSTDGSGSSVFVTRLEGGGENLMWEKMIDMGDRDLGEEIVIDNLGRAHVTGAISIEGLANGVNPLTFQGGTSDIFYTRITPFGAIDYFTYLGGSGEDRGFSLAGKGDSEENFCVFIAGSTLSEDVETIQPLEGGSSLNGGADLLLYALCDVEFDPPCLASFTKTAPPMVLKGNPMSYNLIVNNQCDIPAPVTITDQVPTQLQVTGVSGTGCTFSGNTVSCSFTAQPGSQVITIYVNAREDISCPVTTENTAALQVAGFTFTASATTLIQCSELCGNGVVDTGEACDGTPGCRSNCTLMECGDGILDPGEGCDDGNNVATDGCHDCQIVTNPCGNGIVDAGEECDGGPNCRSNCTLRRCGDGILDPGEACDDGNTNALDGCAGCEETCTSGEICTSNGDCDCPPGYACNQFAGMVEDCFLIFCDTYALYHTDCQPVD